MSEYAAAVRIMLRVAGYVSVLTGVLVILTSALVFSFGFAPLGRFAPFGALVLLLMGTAVLLGSAVLIVATHLRRSGNLLPSLSLRQT